MPGNIKIGYIIHFCHHSHEQINSAYESMCDEENEEVIKILTSLRKFINETIKDYQNELIPEENDISNVGDSVINDNCSDRACDNS